MLKDLKYALRNLHRTPGFTITVVLTLALGIGANTAIFSVVDALLFKPLPYADADRLYAVTFATNEPLGSQYWPYPKYAAFAAEQTVFESTAAYARTTLTITARQLPVRTEAEVVTATYFPLLRVTPALGRVFTAEENQVPDRDAVVVLSDALWRRVFGANPRIVGTTVTIKNRAYDIVGVMPPSFRGQTGSTELWVPTMMAEHFMYKGAATESFGWWIRVVGRLKPEVSPELAGAQMSALSDRVNQLAPAMMKMAMKDGRMLLQLLPFRTIKVDPAISRSFAILLAAVGFVLLIACANTASLLLGRAVSRQNEFAVRRALGASNRHIIRQVLVESVLLAAAAGVAALIVAIWSLQWLVAVKPMNATGFWSQYARTFDYFSVSLDPRIALFNFAVALGVGLVFGLLPGFRASRSDLSSSLNQRAGTSRSGFRGVTLRGALVVAEVSLSLVLLVCAGLTIRSFARAATADLGFEPDQVVMMSISTERQPVGFYRELLSRAASIAGVQNAALVGGAPISSSTSRGPIEIEGRPNTLPRVQADFNVVTPSAFTTLGMRRIAGRLLTDDDRENAPRAAVINRTFAAAGWPGEDAVGKRIRHGFRLPGGDPLQWTTVVGVVEDVANGPLEEPRLPMLYLSSWQPLGTPAAVSLAPGTILLRTSLAPAAVANAAREQIRQLDPSAPLYDIASMREQADRVTARYRYTTGIMTALAGLALLLAAIGIYGVISYAVAMRTREIGIRVALGASPRNVLALLLRGGFGLAIIGTVLGLVGAFAGSRVLANMLYGVTPRDPLTFVVVSIVMMGIAALATYIPARRALRVDPVVALKAE